jgi:hypothetical protein
LDCDRMYFDGIALIRAYDIIHNITVVLQRSM